MRRTYSDHDLQSNYAIWSIQAEWNNDEESRVEYSGSADAIAYFKDSLALNSISGAGGALIRFDTLEPSDLYGFCQSEKAGISVIPSLDDLMSEFEEEDCSAAPSSDDSVTGDGLVFNMFIEGELPESRSEEGEDRPEVRVALVTAETRKEQKIEESSDDYFLALASIGDVDFYDKAVTDRLAALAKKYTSPESTCYPLIMQAKTAAKNWITAEFEKTIARYRQSRAD